ncbi:MAG: hypothetical protein ABSC94_28105 [Polyangiaceae bacterium]|jgi:hypothetical protein
MKRYIDAVWLLLIVCAVGVTVACSSSSDSGDSGTPETMSGG